MNLVRLFKLVVLDAYVMSCGGGGGSTPKADPVAEREKAQEEATQKANMELLTAARRRRLGMGLLSSKAQIGTVVPKPAQTSSTPTKGRGIDPSVFGDA